MKPVDFVTDKVTLCGMTRRSGSMVHGLSVKFFNALFNREPGTVNRPTFNLWNIVQAKGKIKKTAGRPSNASPR